MSPDNGWNEWSRHVLAELERLNNCYDELNKSVNNIHVEIAKLKVKSGIWGAIGGIATFAIAFFIKLWGSK